MSEKTNILSIKNNLNKVDYQMLMNIYRMRCLSIKQAWATFYKPHKVPFDAFVKKRVYPLLKYGIIETVKYNDQYALFLTNDGIEIIKEKFGIASEIYNNKTRKIEKGYYTANQLQVLPKLINHQVALNQFVLDFQQRNKLSGVNEVYKYYDEKYVSKYGCIRPDGMIGLSGVDLFLEMDMNTESKKQLFDKWNRYRIFLNTGEFINQKNKVIVLFIIDCNANQVQARKDLVLYTLYQTIVDGFEENFEVYIGTKEELLDCIFDKIIPEKNNSYLFDEVVMEKIVNRKYGFTVSQGSKMRQVFRNSSYNYYIRKIKETQKIATENGKLQEFLFDEYMFQPTSALNKVALLQRNSSIFKVNYGREIDYILVADSLDVIFHDLKTCGIVNTPHVYYTTPKRMATMPFCKALCIFDEEGNYFNFENNALEKSNYEGTLKIKTL